MAIDTNVLLSVSRAHRASTARKADAAGAMSVSHPGVELDNQGTGGNEPLSPATLPLDVRPVTFRDLAGLRRLDALYRLDQPDAQLVPFSALRAGLGGALPWRRGRRPTFVASSGDRLVGFAQFHPRRPDQRWVLIALGASVGVFDADPVWEALVAYGVRSAGLRGVKRLFARLPVAVGAGGALRRLGWTPYATEAVFVAHDMAIPARAPRVRRQEPADTWAIHQLYSVTVPRPVQDAEALTSHHWEVVTGGSARREVRVVGSLIEDGHLVIGYARTTSRGRTHVLELVYHPDHSGVVDDLIDGALVGLPTGAGSRVFCTVRGYQTEAATRLEKRGFTPTLEQDLLIKYTTASARLPAFDAVPFHLEVRDKLPRRVPTFLHGRPGDRSTL